MNCDSYSTTAYNNNVKGRPQRFVEFVGTNNETSDTSSVNLKMAAEILHIIKQGAPPNIELLPK
jgi:ribosomal protein S16